MAWAEVIISDKLLLVFRCFTNKMVLLGFATSKAINFSFKDYFDRSICNFRDLHGRKPYKFGVQVSSSRLCSMPALCSTQRNRFTQTSLSKVCSMYWQKYKSQIVGLCSFNNFSTCFAEQQNPISNLCIILETKPESVNVLEVCQIGTIKTTLSQGL